MKKLFENWRKHLNEAAVPHSAQHVVKKMKKTGLSAKEALKSLTTDLSDEEAERWLERHKDEMESAKQDLNEGGAQGHYEPGRAVADIDAPAEPQDNLPRDIRNVASYINAWFNARAQGNTGFRGTNLSDYLRKGAAGEEWDKYSGRVSFKKALGEVAPENVEEFKELFMKLADGIEQDPSLLDSKKIGKKGNWYEVAKSL